MKKYDFLFVYEIKNRELESVCLLKYELERRGYSVAVVETWWAMQHYHHPISASVLVTFALYGDPQISFVSSFGRDFKIIVNLYWEQIYTNAVEADLGSSRHISGNARNMIHIAWGPFTANKLVNLCGVPEQNVKVTGHIGMDFIKPRLYGYYMERDELLRQYRISTEKKLLLFISSFSYVGMPRELLMSEVYQSAGLSVQDFEVISYQTQSILLKWIKEILLRHPECVFVYRPHPTEVGNKVLEETERELPNFRVIRDYSVKQWISVADKIYTWYSTSVADAYLCKKSFDILRPIEIPYDRELVIYNNCKLITTQQEFENSINNPEVEFPIRKEMFDLFYDFHEEIYSYVKICDTLESALRDPIDRCAEFRKTDEAYIIYLLKKPLRIAKFLSLRLLGWAYVRVFFKRTRGALEKKAKYQAYVREMIQNNYAGKREIQALQNRIQEIILGNTDETF